MSYHLNAATEQYSDDDDDDLDGRQTVPFMRAIPHLMVPLPEQDELELNDPPAWQLDPESASEVVPMPEVESSDPLDTTTFIPGTNVAMWPLPSQHEPNAEAPLSASAMHETAAETAEQPSEQATSQSSATSPTLRTWFVGTFTVLLLEAAVVATANLYRAGYLSFIW